MQFPFLASPGTYSFLYFCKIDNVEEVCKNLVDYIASICDQDNCCLGFDRSLWSVLSSGQMPSQLYTFNFYGSQFACEVEENILVLLSKEELEDVPEYLSFKKLALSSMNFNEGAVAESFEEDEEFQGCYYASCLVWDEFIGELPKIDNVQNLWFDSKVQLLVGKSTYAQDDWVETYFQKDSISGQPKFAAHLLLPCQEKLMSLKEAVQDKEKIHLDSEIKGIYC